MRIDVRGLSKAFGAHQALRDVTITIRTGELVALLGPSGSGKTTLLRVIAGLEAPDRGSVCFDGADTTARSARSRRVGFVFQHYALFRHMTVFENVAFGLRVRPRARRPAPEEIRRRVDELLALVQLDYLGDRYPSQLSGGQRQRVALARALALHPRLLLLDEPLGALDQELRRQMQVELRALQRRLGITFLLVTHDQEEALTLSDRIGVMNAGRLEQVDAPVEVFERPRTPFVARFLGAENLFAATAVGGSGARLRSSSAFAGSPARNAYTRSGKRFAAASLR